MNFKKFLTLVLTLVFIESNACVLNAMANKPGDSKKSKEKCILKCNIKDCEAYSFSSQTAFRSHQALDHFICPYCPENFKFASYRELIDGHYPAYNHPIDYCEWCKKYVSAGNEAYNRGCLARHKNLCGFNQEKNEKWSVSFTDCAQQNGGKYNISIIEPKKSQTRPSVPNCSTGLNKHGKSQPPEHQGNLAARYTCAYYVCSRYIKPFDTEEDLRLHLLLKHHRCPYQQGQSCLREFDSCKSLIMHYTKVNHMKDFCSYCKDFIVLPSDQLLLKEHTIDCKKRWLEENSKVSQRNALPPHGAEVLERGTQEGLPLCVEPGFYPVAQSPCNHNAHSMSLSCGVVGLNHNRHAVIYYMCNCCMRSFDSEEKALEHVRLRVCCQQF